MSDIQSSSPSPDVKKMPVSVTNDMWILATIVSYNIDIDSNKIYNKIVTVATY